MENTPAYRARYREFLKEVEDSVPTDWVPYVPQDLIRNGRTLPVLATFVFNPFGPTVQTIGIMTSGDHETADILFRRDLNPFAEPYQVPIGILSQPWEARFTACFDIISQYLSLNGVCSKVTSREFLGAWPTAIVLSELAQGVAPVVATAFFDAARHADMQVVEEYLDASRFGPELWIRASHEIDQALDRITNPEATTDEETQPIRWSSFLAWWSHVTSQEMVMAAVSETPLAWSGSINHTPLAPEVDNDDFRRWIILWYAAYLHGLEAEDLADSKKRHLQLICEQFPFCQIRPSDIGWVVTDRDTEPETGPFELEWSAVESAGAEGDQE